MVIPLPNLFDNPDYIDALSEVLESTKTLEIYGDLSNSATLQVDLTRYQNIPGLIRNPENADFRQQIMAIDFSTI